MAESSAPIAAGSGKPPDAPLYEPQHRTVVEANLSAKVKCETIADDKTQLGTLHLDRVGFELELARVPVNDGKEVDVIMGVKSVTKLHDPNFRCSFTVNVACTINDNEISVSKQVTQTKEASSTDITVLRARASASPLDISAMNIRIELNGWSGLYFTLSHEFTERTVITDAALIVEGRHLYVSRSILAIHSAFFNTLFYGNKFKEATQDEFVLPDVSFEDMQLFLKLIYANVADDNREWIHSFETVEAMLVLAERFLCDTVKRIMEKILMHEIPGEVQGLTHARALLLADRFRLSASINCLMEQVQRLRHSANLVDRNEYMELSEPLRSAIPGIYTRQWPDEGTRKRRMADINEAYIDALADPSHAQAIRQIMATSQASDGWGAHDDCCWWDFDRQLRKMAEKVAGSATTYLTSQCSTRFAVAVKVLQEISAADFARIEKRDFERIRKAMDYVLNGSGISDSVVLFLISTVESMLADRGPLAFLKERLTRQEVEQ